MTNHLKLVLRLRMDGVILPLPNTPSRHAKELYNTFSEGELYFLK